MSEQQSLALAAGQVAKPTQHDLECGCRIEMDPDGPVWLIAPCSEHAQGDISEGAARRMGYELDDLVRVACGGRKVERLRPKDPFR